MKRLLFFPILILSFSGNAQNVNIPDANFKAYLVANTQINTNSDTEIQITEANAYAGQIYCSSQSITDLTGIEEFTSLTTLDVAINQLTSLDLSNNVALTTLSCGTNPLGSLDVSSNVLLTRLYCNDNQLTSLDLTTNIALVDLICSGNQLVNLNLNNNTNLETLNAENNLLTALDLSNNSLIETVNVQDNSIATFTKGTNNNLLTFYATNNSLTTADFSDLPMLYTLSLQNSVLTSLNVQNCTNLTYLYITDNDLSTIDLSTNLNLENLLCASNNFTSFDFSGMQYFKEFIASNNQLVSVNIANGNNANMGTNYFKTDNNPNLTCIEVDDVNYSTTNWLNVDGTATFSLNCSNGVDENVMNELVVFPNPTKDVFTISSNEKINSIDIYNAMGKLVQTTNSATSTLTDFENGVYFISVNTEGGSIRSKIIKE